MSEYVGPVSTDTAAQLFHEGNFQDCIKCAEKVIETHPDDAKAYLILGAAYAKSGSRGMAIAAFERSVTLDPSPRAHYNLGKAYEQSDRMVEAVTEYRHAVDADSSYQPALEALDRLGHLESTPAPPPDAHAQPHLLYTGVINEEPTQLPVNTASPADANNTGKPSHTRLDDLQPVGVPVTPIPTAPPPGRLPDLSGLEARARENEEKARQAQRSMVKAGLIYGIIVGPIGLMGAACMFRLRFLMDMQLLATAIEGLILGAIVGYWVGYTCGDDISGAKVGFLAGFLGHGIQGLVTHGSIQQILVQALIGGVILGIAGFFIGMVVENSIGQ